MGENCPVILILGFCSGYTHQYMDVYLLSGFYAATVYVTRLIHTTNDNTEKSIDKGGNLYSYEPTVTFSRLSVDNIGITINSKYSGKVYIETIG